MNSDASNPQESSQSSIVQSSKTGPMNPSNGGEARSAPERATEHDVHEQNPSNGESSSIETPAKKQSARPLNDDLSDVPSAEKKTADMEVDSDAQISSKQEPDKNQEEIVCSACGFESSFVPEGMIICELCNAAHYCSNDCKTWDWDHGGHKKACREARMAKRRPADQLAESSQHSALLKASSHSAIDLLQGSTSTGIDSASSNQQSMAVSEIFDPQNTSSSGLSASGLWENERLTNTSGHSIELLPRKEKSSATSSQESRLSAFFEQQKPLHQQPHTTSYVNPYLTQRSTTARGNSSLRGSNHNLKSPSSSQESDPEAGTDPSSSEGNNSSSWSSDHSKPRMGASGHANSSLLGSNTIPAFSNGAESEYTEEEVYSDDDYEGRLNDINIMADDDAEEFAEEVMSDSEQSLDIMNDEDEDDESVLQSIIEEVSENPDEEPEKEGSWRSRELYDDEAMKKAHASVASMLDTADEALANNSHAGPDVSQSEDTSDHIYEIVDVVEYSTNTENTGATEDTEIVYISGKEYQEKYKTKTSTKSQLPPGGKKRKTAASGSLLPSSSTSSRTNSVASNDFQSLLGEDNNEESPMNSFHSNHDNSVPLPSQSQRTDQSSEPTEENYESFAMDTSHQVSISQNQSEHMSESAGSFANESDSENQSQGGGEQEAQATKKGILGLPSIENSLSNEETGGNSDSQSEGGESATGKDTRGDRAQQHIDTIPARRRSSNNSSGNVSLELYPGSEDFDLDDADQVRRGSIAKKSSLKDFREAYSRADSFSSENYKDFRQVYADRSVSGEQTVGSRSSRSHTNSSGGSKSEMNRSIGDLHKDLPTSQQVPEKGEEISEKSESSGRRGSMSRSEALKVSINKALRDYEKLYGEEAARGAFEKLAQAVLSSDETPQSPTKSDISTVTAPAAEANSTQDNDSPKEGPSALQSASSVNKPIHAPEQSPRLSKSQRDYYASPASARSVPSRGVTRSLSGQSYSSWALPTDYSVFSTNIVSDSSTNKHSPEPLPPKHTNPINDSDSKSFTIGQRLSNLRDQADQMKSQAPSDYRQNMVLTNSDNESVEAESPQLAESSVSSNEDVARLGALPQTKTTSDLNDQIPPNHAATTTVMRIMSPPRNKSQPSERDSFVDDPEPDEETPISQSTGDGSISLTASSGQGDEGPRYLKYRSLLSKGALAITDAAARMLNFASSEDSGEPHGGSGSTRTPTSSPDGEDVPESPYEEYRQAPSAKATTPDRISLAASSAEILDSSPRYFRYRNLLASSYTPEDCPSDAELGLDSNMDANTPERCPSQRTLDPWATVETPERIQIDLDEMITAESPRYLQYRTSLAKRIAVLKGASDIESDNSSSDESTDSKAREVKDLESKLSSLEAQLHSYLNKGSAGKERNQTLDERMAEYLRSDNSRQDMKEKGRRNSWVGVGMDFSSSADESMGSDGSSELIRNARLSPGNKRKSLNGNKGVAEGAAPYLQFDASMHDSDYTKINESASVSVQDDDLEIDVEEGLYGKAPRGGSTISPTPSEKKIGGKKYKQNKYFWCVMFLCLLIAVPLAIILGVLLHDDGGNASIGRSSAIGTSSPVPPQDASSAPTISPPTFLPTSSPTLEPLSQIPSFSPTTSKPTVSIAPTITPSSAPSLVPSSDPSSPPTTTQGPSSEPSAPLEFPDAELFSLLSESAFDDGIGLETRNSPQYRAYLWLAGRDIANLSDASKLQRYSVAVVFYSLGGEQWNDADRENWLETDDECTWTFSGIPCDSNGIMISLDLGFYDFEGSIPVEIGHLSDLNEINLSGKNGTELAGSLPAELGFLSGLESFVAPNNQIEGPIPTGLNWPLITDLDLRNNMLSDLVPDDISLMISLESLNLAHNKLSGALTESIGSLSNLEFLDIRDNQFEGVVPSTIGNLENIKSINLSQNGFTSLPSTIGSLSTLKTLLVGGNDLSGQLFDNWGSLDNLETLVLRDNDYQGPIPGSLGGMASIQTLDLSFNMFSEEIPDELGSLSTVLHLFLNSNKLSGAIPSALQGLLQIDFLRLDDNDLSGAVPTELCSTLGNNQVPKFFSDCDVLSGNGEIQCPLGTCCTHCCASGTCECVFQGTNLDFLCFF